MNSKIDKMNRQTLQTISEFGNSYNAFIYSKIRPYLGDRLLEVGSGIGNISSFLVSKENLHKKIFLTDISPYSLRFLNKKFKDKSNVMISKFNLNFNPSKSINQFRPDTIICLNVLEHIKQDQLALMSLRKILSNSGKLILMTPACQFAYGKLDQVLGHYRRYYLTELKYKLKRSGFKILNGYYINFFGLLAWWFYSRVLKKTVFPKKQFFLFSKFYQIFSHFERLIYLPIGLTCFIVAKKDQ